MLIVASQDKAEIGGLTKNRVETLTDGVFAIAMTLMVFTIRVPQLEGGAVSQLSHRLLELWPTFFIYGVTFAVLGIFWVAHHTHFYFVRHIDRNSIWINMTFLLFITTFPFSASLLGAYPGQRVAVICYGVNLSLAALLLFCHLKYATGRGRLTGPEKDEKGLRLAKQRLLACPFLCGVSIVLSFFHPLIASMLYLVIPVMYIIPGRVDRYFADVLAGRAG
ncbi:MAG: TMEM175 family protein [Candidatus Acidiferrales bacterium]